MMWKLYNSQLKLEVAERLDFISDMSSCLIENFIIVIMTLDILYYWTIIIPLNYAEMTITLLLMSSLSTKISVSCGVMWNNSIFVMTMTVVFLWML